jgi:nucleoside 2-deoxyribosyltransferase
VCTSLGIECRRSDEIDEAGRITEQIYEAIENADALVADISDRNPNVMYELGYAHALKKAVIILNSGSDAPFDVADFRWIGYRIDDLSHSKEKLANSLRSTLRLGERS